MSDLAEQLFFLKHRAVPKSVGFSVRAKEKPESHLGAPAYSLEIALPDQPVLRSEVDVNGPIWAPEIYAGIIEDLAAGIGLEPSAPQEAKGDTDLLLALTDGSAATLERENLRLSEALERDPGDVELHEKAAVILGAFTLRDRAGDFFDIRAPLCRITAHLAMARFLAGGRSAGVNGQVGRAMLFSLMNNQTAALEQMDGITGGDPAVNRWVRVLRAYNTSDYRTIAGLKNPSWVERIAWFRAFGRAVDVDLGWPRLTEKEKVSPDFLRIASERSFSVGTGHELYALMLRAELAEVDTVFELSHGRSLRPDEVLAQLNEPPARGFGPDGKPRVIGWGQWAHFLQRHLCHAVRRSEFFLRDLWGVPDEARDFADKCDATFGELRLYPFVRRFNCADARSYRSAVDDGLRVTAETPHLTPVACWNSLSTPVSFAPLYQPGPHPHINQWVKHNPPPGTAYDMRARFKHPTLWGDGGFTEVVDRLHEMAPYDYVIAHVLIQVRYHKQPTYDQASEVYRRVLPYATYAMVAVAQTALDQPERYEALMTSACELDPSRYIYLGEYFQDRGMDDKAAACFEKGSEACSDQVLVASQALWRVKYHLARGETEKARRVADEGAKVYSAVGLQAKAEFLERTGDYRRAFEWYVKLEGRYGNSGPLVAFCMRYKDRTGSTRYDEALGKRVAGLFPGGIRKVGLDDFQSPPVDGVLIAEENERIREAGLKRGDIIVAVFGVRVHTMRQYVCAREFDSDPELDLIVWQGDIYREVKASPPNHLFGVTFVDYPAR